MINKNLEQQFNTTSEAFDRTTKAFDRTTKAFDKIIEILQSPSINESNESKIEKNMESQYSTDPKWSYVPNEIKNRIRRGDFEDKQIVSIMLMPWDTYPSDKYPYKNLDITAVSKKLNETHFGLYDAKESIYSYLVSIKNSASYPLVILLNGEPGTGKTTFATAIASAINRKFSVVNLNTLSDGNHGIVGSNRYYIGSTYGSITKAIIETERFDSVIVFDELDKCATSDRHGNILNALVYLLDENNLIFRDTFLDISYDISNMIFIFTSNSINNIPSPLLNRFGKIININVYTNEEKFKILQEYVIPKLKQKYSGCLLNLSPSDIEDAIQLSNHDRGIRTCSKKLEDIYIYRLRENEKNTNDITSEHLISNIKSTYTPRTIVSNGWVDLFYQLYFQVSTKKQEQAMCILKENIPRKIYRYRSGTNLCNLINELKGNIYVATRDQMNDPLDIKKLFENDIAINYATENMLRNVDKNISINMDQLIHINRDIDRISDFYRYACFSTKVKNMMLWSHYANYGKGCCIEYTTDLFDSTQLENLFPIQYVDRIYDGAKEMSTILNNNSNDISYARQYMKKWMNYHALQKLKDWSCEQEWRLLFSPAQYRDMYRILDDSVQEGEISFCKPSTLYLGVNANLSDYEEILNYCYKVNINVYQLEVALTGITEKNILKERLR